MIQPKFAHVKQSRMKRHWRAQAKDFAQKHWQPLAHGAAGLAGAVAAHYSHHPSAADIHFASTPELGERAAQIARGGHHRDLPGPRSPAFYAHRYSHLLPRGAFEAGMRRGTAEQRGQPRADQAHRGYTR